jgi:hypothetical protein
MIEILEYIESFHKYIIPGKGKKLTALFAVADTIRGKARAALSAPPRNCDVGTLEEQAERFSEYCDSEVCKRNRCRFNAKALCIERCALAWAQMPYNEGGAK